MFGFKRRNDILIAALLEKVIDKIDNLERRVRVGITQGEKIMATQAAFNAKIAELGTIIEVVRGTVSAQRQVIANLEAANAALRADDIDTSALDAVLEQARAVQAVVEPALDPAQDTPAPSDVPTVDPAEGAETVEPLPEVATEEIVPSVPESTDTGSTTPTEPSAVEQDAAEGAQASADSPNAPEGTTDVAPSVDSALTPADAEVANAPADGTTDEPAGDQGPVAERQNPTDTTGSH